MTGASFELLAVILKAGRATVASSSVTLITMPLVTPTWLLPGVPNNRPVPDLNVAQAG